MTCEALCFVAFKKCSSLGQLLTRVNCQTDPNHLNHFLLTCIAVLEVFVKYDERQTDLAYLLWGFWSVLFVRLFSLSPSKPNVLCSWLSFCGSCRCFFAVRGGTRTVNLVVTVIVTVTEATAIIWFL